MNIKTADLCDQYHEKLHVVQPMFRNYGGRSAFAGRIATVKVHEDNKLVGSAFEKSGAGQVLVVDGGGSLRSALVGGNLARRAADNGWEGVIVYGCVRDALELADTPLGVLALATNPLRPGKHGFGEIDVPVRFGGATFRPGEYVYADEDGVVVSPVKLG